MIGAATAPGLASVAAGEAVAGARYPARSPTARGRRRRQVDGAVRVTRSLIATAGLCLHRGDAPQSGPGPISETRLELELASRLNRISLTRRARVAEWQTRKAQDLVERKLRGGSKAPSRTRSQGLRRRPVAE